MEFGVGFADELADECAGAHAAVDVAVGLLEKANVDLDPELLSVSEARERLRGYAKVQRLAAYGVAALSRRVGDASSVAKVTGTSVGKAKDTITTGRALKNSGELSGALERGEISGDQAAEIAKAEEAVPGVAAELVPVAEQSPFHVLRERARKAKLEAEACHDLAERQHAARDAGSYTDELGMVNIRLTLEPHVGTPVVARAEAEAARLAQAAKREGHPEPFRCCLADAYAAMLTGSDIKGPSRRPELVVLVSHEITQRGWTGMRDGEVCKIPGVGPVSAEAARRIANDAFLSGVFFDGKDLRQFARWSRHIPVEVAVALELGDPPGFDGVACVDCGNRFRTEFDHIEPHSGGGPASWANIDPRCWSCHQAKTNRDRKASKHKPPEP